jgi:hypothetical protein
MPDAVSPRPPEKTTVAVLKAGTKFQAWFKRLQDQTRLPAGLILDAALVAYAKSIGFEEPPPR